MKTHWFGHLPECGTPRALKEFAELVKEEQRLADWLRETRRKLVKCEAELEQLASVDWSWDEIQTAKARWIVAAAAKLEGEKAAEEQPAF